MEVPLYAELEPKDITELKHELNELKRLLDFSLDVICTIDAEGRFVRVSAASRDIWGYEPYELIQSSYIQLVHEEDRLRTLQSAQAIMAGFAVSTFENRYIKKDGTIVPMLWSAYWKKDEKLMYCVAKNNSEKKKAEEIENKKYEAIYDSIQDGYFAVDSSWTITAWNRLAEETLKRKKADIIGKNLWDEFEEAINLKFYSQSLKAMKEQTTVHFEEYLPSVALWFQVSVYPTAKGLSIYFENINDRKNKELELTIAIERFEMAAKATTDVLWDWDIATNTCYFNDNFTTLFGYSNKADQVYRNWVDNIHEEDLQRIIESLEQALADKSTSQWQKEYRFYRSDKSIAYILDRGFFIRDSEGRAIRAVGSMQDITEARTIQEAKLQVQKRYQLLFDQSPIPKFIYEEKSLRIIDVNRAALQLYGWSREEFLTMKVFDIRPDNQKAWITRLARKNQGKLDFRFNGIVKHKNKSEQLIDVEITTHAFKENDDIFVVAFVVDITEKLATQRQMGQAIIQTQENERTVIGKELHDNVNQMLTTAKLYIQNAEYYSDLKTDFLQKGVAIIQRSIDEIRGLSRTLITPTLSDIGFKETVDELLHYYKDLNLFDLDFNYRLDDNVLCGDIKLSMYRILQELFNNTVKYAKATDVKLFIHNRTNFIRIAYYDNGVGFNQKGLKKGVGLTNIKSRIGMHNGRIRIDTAPGKGTKVLMVIPI